MKAAGSLVELLRSEGVEYVFGNPGTTELPFMDAMARAEDLRYVLGLHESAAVAMADGYARATRRPAFLNLHIAAGLANGLSMVLNARRARTPLVVTAGQQDRRHLIEDPMLGGDLVAIAQGAFKEAVEVTRVEDLPVLMRRAFLHAAAPPAGPVLVSIPVDVLEEEVSGELPARSRVRPLGRRRGSWSSPMRWSPHGRRRSSRVTASVARMPSTSSCASPRRSAPRCSTSRCTTRWTSRRRTPTRADAAAGLRRDPLAPGGP